MSSFDLNIRFVYFRAKGARARVYFPAPYFLYSVARIAQTPSLFFVNIMKEKTPLTQNRSAMSWHKHVYLDVLAYRS